MKSLDFIKDEVIFKGNLYYEDMTPVAGVLVIMEMIFPIGKFRDKSGVLRYKYKSKSIYTTSNAFGEYYFRIYNKKCLYRIKIFN